MPRDAIDLILYDHLSVLIARPVLAFERLVWQMWSWWSTHHALSMSFRVGALESHWWLVNWRVDGLIVAFKDLKLGLDTLYEKRLAFRGWLSVLWVRWTRLCGHNTLLFLTFFTLLGLFGACLFLRNISCITDSFTKNALSMRRGRILLLTVFKSTHDCWLFILITLWCLIRHDDIQDQSCRLRRLLFRNWCPIPSLNLQL